MAMKQPESHNCPRFDKCSAPLCPLDVDWRMRAHLPEDRICFYLSESVKPGASTRIIAELFEPALRMTTSNNLPRVIKRKLAVSALTTSRIEAGRRVGRSNQGVDTRKRRVEGV